jgi:hypothetical protein
MVMWINSGLTASNVREGSLIVVIVTLPRIPFPDAAVC